MRRANSILRFAGLGPRGPEQSHLAHIGIGGKQLEGVAQFPNGRLNYTNITAGLHIGEEFKGIFDDLGHKSCVVTAALMIDQFLTRVLFSISLPAGLY